jgi:hypothetical protein
MACGTPAIVCRNSALPEVLGDAALYVDENDPTEMAEAITRLYDAATRAQFVERGLRQAQRFSFARMAQELAQAFVATDGRLRAGELARPSQAWAELRECQVRYESPRPNDANGDLPPWLGSSNASATGTDLERALQTIADMRRSPFWRARELALRLLRKSGFPRRG